MIRRPPRSTLDRSSAASDVYKRQDHQGQVVLDPGDIAEPVARQAQRHHPQQTASDVAVSYTHLRAHETVLDLVCRLLLEKKKITRDILSIADIAVSSITATACLQSATNRCVTSGTC